MEVLYKFNFETSFGFPLYGLFIAEKEKIEELINSGKIVYFGKIDEKDVFGPVEKCDITNVTIDEKVLAVVKAFKLEHGINPLKYPLIDKSEII